jgi:hypothetical protein
MQPVESNAGRLVRLSLSHRPVPTFGHSSHTEEKSANRVRRELTPSWIIPRLMATPDGRVRCRLQIKVGPANYGFGQGAQHRRAATTARPRCQWDSR